MKIHKRRGFVLLPVVVGLTLIAAIAYYLTREGAMNVDINASEIKIVDAKNVAEAGIRYATQDLNTKGCNAPASNYTLDLGNGRSVAVGTGVLTTPPGTATLDATATIGDTKSNIASTATIYGDTLLQTATIQGSANTSDTTLDPKFPGDATSYYLELFNKNGGLIRPIIKFDLTSIPRGSLIQSASLELNTTSLTAGTWNISLHKLTKEWDVGTATWALSKTGTPWTVPGGDFEPTATNSQILTAIGLIKFDVTPLADQWVNDKSSNSGVVLLPPLNANISFGSSNNPDTTLQPKLVVKYIGPRKHLLLKGTTGKDTYIALKDNNNIDVRAINFSKAPELVIDNGPKLTHSLIKFDLASIPANAQLVYAKLIMTVSTPPTGAYANPRGISNNYIDKGTAQISIHKMLQDWEEGTGTATSLTNDGASWNQAFKTGNIFWGPPTATAPPPLPTYDGPLGSQFRHSNDVEAMYSNNTGGSYDVTYDAQYPKYVPYKLVEFYDTDNSTKKILSGDTVDWDITPIVSEWLTNQTQNHGLLMRADSQLAQAKFHSFEQAAPLLRPTIELGYYMPCNSPKPVTVASSFLPTTISVNQTSTLSIVLANPNAAPMTVTSFSNSLPAGLSIAAVANNLFGNCPAPSGTAITSLSTSLKNGITTILGNNFQIPAGGSCTISAIVKSAPVTISTTYTNTTLPNEVVASTNGIATSNPFFASSPAGQLKVNPSVTFNSVADTAIWKSASLATSNCGVCSDLAASTPNANQVNSLYRFDLSSVPAASTVTSAKLRLYVTQIVNRTAGQALTLQASPLTASWLEGTDNVVASTGGATWKRRSTALGNWTNQGGDFATINTATTTIPGSFVGTAGSGMWIEFDVTAAAQAMVTSPATNFGFHVQETTVTTLSNEVRLAARENTAPGGLVPQLVITYQ